ncbi:MAG: TolC family protein [Armatimonadota bacterium]
MKKVYLVLFLLILSIPSVADENNEINTFNITIEQAIQTAIKNSPDISAKAEQVEASKAGVDEARSAYFPKFSGQVKHVRQGPEQSISLPNLGTVNLFPKEDTSLAGIAAMPIDINGKIGHANSLARYQLEIDLYNYRNEVEKLIFSVKEAYFELLRAIDAKEVAQASVNVAEERLKNTQARFEAGTVPKFDVTSAQVELANLNQLLISRNNAINIARANLNRILAIDLNTETIPEKNDIKISEYIPDLDDSIQTAYKRRAEIMIAKKAIDAQKANIKLQRANYLPTLGFSYIHNYNPEPSGLSGSKNQWFATLQLEIPLWDTGTTKAKVDKAKAQMKQSENQLEQAQLGIGFEVQSAVVLLRDAIERVSTAGENVSLAEEALRLANIRYDAGISTAIEVTDAQRALTEARVNLNNARYDYAISVARYERATSSQPEIQQISIID